MTVQELIDELGKYPVDMDVAVRDATTSKTFDIDKVEIVGFGAFFVLLTGMSPNA